MRKIRLGLVTFLTVLLLALLGGVYVVVDFATNHYKTVLSSVHVLEGSVNIWKLMANGSRGELQTVREGETAVVKGNVLEENGFLFKTLQPVLQQGTETITGELKDMIKNAPAKKMLKGNTEKFDRLYTEEEFNNRVARRLQEKIPGLTNVSFIISPSGIKAYGTYKRGGFGIEGSARGNLQVSEGGKLTLQLRGMRAASFNLPDFLLRNIEEIFSQAIHEDRLPLKITHIEYLDGSVRVSGQKNIESPENIT